MKVTYKKRGIVGKGLHSGPIVTTQDVQLEIHYEAEAERSAELRRSGIIVEADITIGEPYELLRSHGDMGTYHFLDDVEIDIATLKLVIEEGHLTKPCPRCGKPMNDTPGYCCPHCNWPKEGI
jgi:hypothetical protein